MHNLIHLISQVIPVSLLAYIARRLLYNIPVYLGVIFLVMASLRVYDPVWVFLGKYATQEKYDQKAEQLELDRSFVVQYGLFLKRLASLDFDNAKWNSWRYEGRSVGEMLRRAIFPSLSLTLPALVLTTFFSICVGMISAYFRGRLIDRTLVIFAVLGMSVSFLAYVIVGQYVGGYWLKNAWGVQLFAVQGYESGLGHWPYYCLLPVMISVIVAMGYDTRFYRAALVEETSRDYVTTARAKGVPFWRILFVHILKNALIPIISRIMTTLPFLVTGSILLETFFGIPGMGQELLSAIKNKDFPVVQVFTAVFAGLYILSIIVTDVLYAWADPRVRLG